MSLFGGWGGLGACDPVDPGSPRTLVLALDGVPLRSVIRAREMGAFAGFPDPQPMISTFPSVTNVAFTAMFTPFGVDPAGGYEVAHFDLERNKVVGGTPFGYQERLFAWRDAFDVTSRTIGSKLKTYTPIDGDPLGYEAVVGRLQASGRRDRDGFADEDDWFLETASSEYPDGLRRLVHSLTGTYVENYVTVVFSLKPGFAWGWTSAHLSSKLSGGRLEGTHGGLDADSSVGFFMTDDPEFQPTSAVRADQALAPFAGLNDCLAVRPSGRSTASTRERSP